MKESLLIFAKNLIYGEVKTRLAITVGNETALLVYKHLVNHVIAITADLHVKKIVFYSTNIEKKDVWNNDLYEKQVQVTGNLGERMKHAFAHAFTEGGEKVVIIGTDCMELTSAIIMSAYDHLENRDVVVGPAKDGGYYLLAMKKLHHSLFENITWSSPEVLSQTLQICNKKNLTTYLLPELNDIDDEEDLKQAEDLISIADL